MPDRAVFDESYWTAYTRINELFARRTFETLKQMTESNDSDDVPIIWIHDYHLMLAATTIRLLAEETNIQCKIGFFLHIPFPAWDLIKIFPWHDLILQGILGCDLVSFQVEDYCINFIDSCGRGLGCRVDKSQMLVDHGGRTVRVRSLPIGIPFKRFQQLAINAKDSGWTGLKVCIIFFSSNLTLQYA